MSQSTIYQQFSPPKAAIRVGPMLRIHGYSDLERVRPAIRRTAETVAALAESLLAPEVCYRRVPITACNGNALTLESGTVFHSDAFSKFVSGCTEVVVFVLTIGADLDREVQHRLNDDRLLEALFLETAGWLGIEESTRSFAQHLRRQAQDDGYRITRRMGPGYSYKVNRNRCDWALEEQQLLFSLFDEARLSVCLLESCAMIPKMSRSGLYGIASPLSIDPGAA